MFSHTWIDLVSPGNLWKLCTEHWRILNNLLIKEHVHLINLEQNYISLQPLLFFLWDKLKNDPIYGSKITIWSKPWLLRITGPLQNIITASPSVPGALFVQPHLMWSSLEDTGALVYCFGPQADIFILHLLGCAVHGLRNQAAFWNLTLQVACMSVPINSYCHVPQNDELRAEIFSHSPYTPLPGSQGWSPCLCSPRALQDPGSHCLHRWGTSCGCFHQ